MSQLVVHRDVRWWPDPMRFAPGVAVERPKFVYFPFGGGQRWQLRRAVETPVAFSKNLLSLQAADGLSMRLTPRR